MILKSILFATFLFVSQAYASTVDTITAKNTAKNFIFERININTKINYKDIDLQFIKAENINNEPAYYIYNLKNQTGFVIISAENETFPILGYSYETNFDNTQEPAPAFVEWMNHYKEQIEYIRGNNIIGKKKNKQAWIKYSTQPTINKSGTKDVSPLLSTTWNQGTYYNELCPADPGGQNGHVWAGCVAVAMAQVMKFWNYPDYGSDNHSYNDYTYGTQTADFVNTYYDWTSMPNSLSNYNTPVATLMYHCGVSVDMSYSTSGSGAYSGTAASSMKRFFDYSHTLYLASKNSYADTTWRDLIKSEIDLGHPLYYSGYPSSGGGHAFNCDGYQGTDHFHFNWGWGGSYNGYFYLNDLTPGTHDYTYSQVAIINAYPDCLNPQCGGSVTTLTDISGQLTDGSPVYGYFTNYSNCSDCEYLIQPSGASSVFVDFDNFLTIEGEDSLYVYDGANDNAPLLYALSGDTIPDSFFSSTGSVYFHFVSDNFRTTDGWQVSYTTAFDDMGVTSVYLPQTKTCGKNLDTVQVSIKNFGANTETNIPITVDVITPSGTVSIDTIIPGPIERNEWQTVIVGTINTLETGTYEITAYTNVVGDTVINSNDTAYSTFDTKTILSVPHAEIFDDLHGQLGNWVDKNWAAFPDYEVSGTDTNYLMRGWIDQWMSMFLIFDIKIENIAANTNLLFDYRFLKAGGLWPPTDSIVLNSLEKMYIVVSADCGISYDTIFTIDTLNHINTTNFTLREISLSTYAGEDIIIGFVTQWDDSMTIVDIDNVIILDKITNNIIPTNQSICENDSIIITGTLPIGGIGGYSYLWEESTDNLTWAAAAGINNLQNFSPGILTATTYYRRIVSDTLIYTDTSSVITITYNLNPTVNIQGSTVECGSTILDEGIGMPNDVYNWSTGDSTQTITVNTSGTYWLEVTDSAGCSGTDTVAVTIYNLPVISLGQDTIICAQDSIILDAGVYDTYLWSTGETSQLITVDSIGTGIGIVTISVQVTDTNTCINNDTINISFNICSGLGNISQEAIKIYPNPTTGIFTIKGKNIKSIEITNVSGQIVYARTLQLEDFCQIDLNEQTKGIYFIKIITHSRIVVKKIVLE